ncbi:transmembrane signal receptor [Lithospermum erythrorhizon]|uniref:Transmembrane signal receptor n=1 Tax=Lithospermum erythrorhizon TaxID=34254 RepID=A0AAV3RJ18_LITER
MSLLISSMSDETLPLAVGKETPRAIWEAVKVALANPSFFSHLALEDKLIGLKQNNMTITEYLNLAKSTFDSLAAIGFKIYGLFTWLGYVSLQYPEPYHGPDRVQVANGQHLNIHNTGTVCLSSPSRLLFLHNTFHAPNARTSLLSVQKFCADNGAYFEFHPSYFVVKDQVTHRLLLTGLSNHDTYFLSASPRVLAPHAMSSVSSSVWHHRLGHTHYRILNLLSPSLNKNSNVAFKSVELCTSYPMGKLTKFPLHLSNKRSSRPLELLFSDLWVRLPMYPLRAIVLRIMDIGVYLLIIIAYTLLSLLNFLKIIFPSILHPPPFPPARHPACISSSIFVAPLRPEPHPVSHGLAHSSSPLASPVPAQPHSPLPSQPTSSPIQPDSEPQSVTTTTQSPTPSPIQPDISSPPRQSAFHPMDLRPHPKPSQKRISSHPHALNVVHAESEPHNFSQANKCPLWHAAMCDEINVMVRTQTWSLVPKNPSMNVVGCRWVYRLKRDSHGNIVRRRARLVARGNHQVEGLDFSETFSPVIKTTTIRTILSLVVSSRWSIRQVDIQNAFLHGSLTETVYMTQPPGFVDIHFPQHVCRLHKSLYGLKQAPRIRLIMLVYVDILVTGNCSKDVSGFIAALSARFVTRDLGDLNFFLGIEAITRPDGSLLLSQRQYILDILGKANMRACKPSSTPLSTTPVSPTISDPAPNPS